VRISLEATILADPSLALGRVGPFGVSLNGQNIIDDAQFFRAAVPSFFERGGNGVTLQFSVERLFSSLKSAEVFLLTHFGALPRSGLITCLCGESGDTQAVYLRNAVLEAVALPGYQGRSVGVQYTIKGSQFESDIPPDEIPGDPDPGEEDLVTRRSRVAIGSAQSSVVVLFSSALASIPTVVPTISRPAGSPAIEAFLREDSITVNGFTVDLSAATPDATYVLHYIAIE
jgi:hypothetical protein